MKAKLLIVLIGLTVMYNSYGVDKKHKGDGRVTITETKSPAAESKMMIVAKLSVKPEKIKDFLAAAKEMVEKTNKESGCIYYQLYQNPYDNSKFVFVEEYTNQAGVDAHIASDYLKAWGPKTKDMLSGPSDVKVVPLPLK